MFLVFQIIQASEKCHVPIAGIQLKDHVISSINVGDIHSCFVSCVAKPRCESVNFYKSKSLCELNSRTIENMPLKKVSNKDSVYFQNTGTK